MQFFRRRGERIEKSENAADRRARKHTAWHDRTEFRPVEGGFEYAVATAISRRSGENASVRIQKNASRRTIIDNAVSFNETSAIKNDVAFSKNFVAERLRDLRRNGRERFGLIFFRLRFAFARLFGRGGRFGGNGGLGALLFRERSEKTEEGRRNGSD